MLLKFGEVWGLGAVFNLGLSFLGLFFLLALIREVLKLVFREPADFGGLGVRFVLAIAAMAAIPIGSVALSEGVLVIAGHFLESGKLAAFQGAFQAAMGAECDYEWYDVLAMVFSMRGMLLVISGLIMLAAMLVKIVVIDVAWPVIFAAEVYTGVISIPLTFLTQRDGLRPYLTRVLSVAIWPVVYSILYVIIASGFPTTLATAKGEGSGGLWRCDAGLATSAEQLPQEFGALPRNEAGVPTVGEPGSNDPKIDGYPHTVSPAAQIQGDAAVLQFLGVVLVYLLLTLQTGAISGRLLGVANPPGLLSMAGGVARASTGIKGALK